jgi:hypothetical protein
MSSLSMDSRYHKKQQAKSRLKNGAYPPYVWPHLEFSFMAWVPRQTEGKTVRKKLQEKVLKKIAGLNGITSEERCKEEGTDTMERRRNLLDMAQTFNIIKRIDKVNKEALLQFAGKGENNGNRGPTELC